MVERKPRRDGRGNNGRTTPPRRPTAADTGPREQAPYVTAAPRERALLVGVDVSSRPGVFSIEESLNELGLLAETAGFEVVGAVTQRLSTPNPAHYVGSGKLEEIKDLGVEHGAQAVIFDDELTPSQGRALEKALGVPVVDRTALILAIFAQRARTREGSLQVRLAQYEYMLPRLTGQWTHLERQTGGVGTRAGAGETQLETDRRIVRRKIADVKRDLEKVRHQRGLYRDRRRRAAIPVIALVGYTNAGKSTLFNRLTEAEVLAEDKLFATLDPVTRRVKLPGGQWVLFTDTVGFVQKLPTDLVAAFRATLEELEDAALLLHVVDITHPHALEQAETVTRVVADLGLADRPVVTALNKIDLALAGELADLSANGHRPEAAANGPRGDGSDDTAAQSAPAPAAAVNGSASADRAADGEAAAATAAETAAGTGLSAPPDSDTIAAVRGGEMASGADELTNGPAAGDAEAAATEAEAEPPPDVLSALREIAGSFPNAVPVSALSGQGLVDLLRTIEATLAEHWVDVTRLIPYERHDLASAVRTRGTVLHEQPLEAGWQITARLPRGVAGWLDRNLAPEPANSSRDG